MEGQASLSASGQVEDTDMPHTVDTSKRPVHAISTRLGTFQKGPQGCLKLPSPPTTLLVWVLVPRIEVLGVTPLTAGSEEPKSLGPDMLATREG